MVARRVEYDPHAEYVARRRIETNGKVIEVGQPVPRSLCPRGERQFEKWFNSRLIMRADNVQHERPNGDAVTPTQAAPLPVPKGMAPAVNIINNAPLRVKVETTVDEATGAVAVTVTDVDRGHSVTTPNSPDTTQRSATEGGEGTAEAGSSQQQTGKLDAPAATDAPPVVYPNEGCIEHAGRGWYNVHYKGETRKVRTMEAAQAALSAWRGDPPVAQLQPGDQVVDGETGGITTVPESEVSPEFTGAVGAVTGDFSELDAFVSGGLAMPGDDTDDAAEDGADDESPRNPPENPYGEGVF